MLQIIIYFNMLYVINIFSFFQRSKFSKNLGMLQLIYTPLIILTDYVYLPTFKILCSLF